MYLKSHAGPDMDCRCRLLLLHRWGSRVNLALVDFTLLHQAARFQFILRGNCAQKGSVWLSVTWTSLQGPRWVRGNLFGPWTVPVLQVDLNIQLSLGLNCSGWQKREDIEAWISLGKRHCIITTFLAFSVWREKAATRPPLHTAPKKRSKVASKASSRVEAARSSSSKQQSNSHFFHTYCYFTSSSSLATLLQLGNSGLSALLLRCVLSTIRGRNWK